MSSIEEQLYPMLSNSSSVKVSDWLVYLVHTQYLWQFAIATEAIATIASNAAFLE